MGPIVRVELITRTHALNQMISRTKQKSQLKHENKYCAHAHAH